MDAFDLYPKGIRLGSSHMPQPASHIACQSQAYSTSSFGQIVSNMQDGTFRLVSFCVLERYITVVRRVGLECDAI